MIDDSKFSKGGKYFDSSRELYDNRPLIKHSLIRKYSRKATEFPQSENWVGVDWDPTFVPSDQINEMLIDAMKHKILGMNSIAMYLFTPDNRRSIIIPPREYRKITDYKQLRNPESSQAKKFWGRVKIYANRRQMPFPKRVYGGDTYTDIDVLNYRINSVGNRLKNNTLKIMGRGANFFENTSAFHNIPTLEVVETVRPLLYLVVLRSLSLPMDSVWPIVDEIITDGMRWVMNRVELITGQEVEKYRINYHEYCRRITEQIREIELQQIGPYTQHKVTEFREPGVIHFITPTKHTRIGEKIHRQLLSEFAQPLSLDKTKIRNSGYLHAFAEVKISSNNLVGRFDLIIVNNRLEVLLIIDLKTHERDDFELLDSHKSQVNSYLKILEDNGFIVDDTIRSLIHIHRKYVPDTIKPVVDWMMKHQELLIKELKSHDFSGCENIATMKSNNGSGKSKFDKTPSLKRESFDFLATPPVYDLGCVGISMWG